MRRRLIQILMLCLLALFTTGCWDYTELELLDFVIGAGVDADEAGIVLVTEMAKTTGVGQETEFEPVVLSTKARTLSGAAHSLSVPAGMEAFWPHTQVFLVSEEVAREGMMAVLEHILRAWDLRSTMNLFVTKGCTAEEVLKSKPPLAAGVSQHLSSTVRLGDMRAAFVPQQVWQFSGDLAALGIAATLPVVQLVHVTGNLVPVVRGAGVFKKDRLVGWLDAEQTQIFGLLKGEEQRGLFVMDTTVEGETFPITYEFVHNVVEIKPRISDGNVRMQIKLELKLGVVAAEKANFLDRAVTNTVQEQLNRAFARRIRELLWLVQEEYNSDIIGFGQVLMRKEPKVWRSHADDWDTHLQKLAADIEVDCRIIFTGLRAEPFAVRN